MNEKLMPCECGSDDITPYNGGPAIYAYVRCTGCGRAQFGDTLAEVTAAWNTRHPTPAADEVEALEWYASAVTALRKNDVAGDRAYDELVADGGKRAIAAMQARSAEAAEDWEATHRYCVKQWEREREEMMRKVVDLRAQLGLRADGSPAEPAGEDPVLYQSRTRPTWERAPDWTGWQDCSREAFDCIQAKPIVNDWVSEARALYTRPATPTNP